VSFDLELSSVKSNVALRIPYRLHPFAKIDWQETLELILPIKAKLLQFSDYVGVINAELEQLKKDAFTRCLWPDENGQITGRNVCFFIGPIFSRTTLKVSPPFFFL